MKKSIIGTQDVSVNSKSRIEEWKPVKNYESLYEVSNYGRVKRLKRTMKYSNGHVCTYPETIIATSLRSKKRKYMAASLTKDKKAVTCNLHRMVAEAFVHNPDPLNKIYVNHEDGDPSNNTAWNLKWVSPEENDTHAVVNNLKMGINLTISQEMIQDFKKLRKEGHSFNNIAKIHGTSPQLVFYHVNGRDGSRGVLKARLRKAIDYLNELKPDGNWKEKLWSI